MLDKPLHWRRPYRIFVDSMGDLFHEEVPTIFIMQVFEAMVNANWHRFQVLTKRSSRLAELGPHLPLTQNIWVGVTVEHQDYLSRVADLRRVPAGVKFLSLEPLLGPLTQLTLDGIDWVIVGGESGPGARPMHAEWVAEIRDRCVLAGVPFFFKQWGGTNKKRNGRLLEGRTWDQMPGNCVL
jgi:protein gp37